jgi:hypothetical protein
MLTELARIVEVHKNAALASRDAGGILQIRRRQGEGRVWSECVRGEEMERLIQIYNFTKCR